MKKLILISTFFTCLCLGCRQKSNQNNQEPPPPEALQDKSHSSEIFTKSRYDNDLVESLYDELIENTKALKDLEDNIKNLREMKTDSTKFFLNFDQKNSSYYSSANSHLLNIKDSLLRQKIKVIIDSSLSDYSSKIANHKYLVSLLDSKQQSLEDLHIALKITRTLGMIEKYQKQNLPKSKTIESAIKEFNKTINRLDTMVHK